MNGFTNANFVALRPTTPYQTGFVSSLLQNLSTYANDLDISLLKTNPKPLPTHFCEELPRFCHPTLDGFSKSGTTAYSRKPNPNSTKSRARQPNALLCNSSVHSFPPVVLNLYYKKLTTDL